MWLFVRPGITLNDKSTSWCVEPVASATTQNSFSLIHHTPSPDLFSLLKTTDALERAYVRDYIHAADYERECSKLIQQFRVLWNTLRDQIPSLSDFARRHALDCNYGIRRLESGMTALSEHSTPSAAAVSGNQNYLLGLVFDLSTQLVTIKDAIELDMTQVITLKPRIEEAYTHITRLTHLPPDFEGRDKMKGWIAKMNLMAAADRLTEGEKEQLRLDIDTLSIQVRAMLDNPAR